MNHFLHITLIETKTGYIKQKTAELALHDSAFRPVLRDTDELVAGAIGVCQGVVPDGSECNSEILPWYYEYHALSDDDSGDLLIRIPNAEVVKIARSICDRGCYLNEPPYQRSYTVGYEYFEKLRLQTGAIEIVLCVDGAIENLLKGRCTASLQWLSAAYRNFYNLMMDIRALEATRRQGKATETVTDPQIR